MTAPSAGRPPKKKTESPMKYKSAEYIEDSDEELEDDSATDSKGKTASSPTRSSRSRRGDNSELVALPEKGENDDEDEDEEESTGNEGNDSDDMDDD